MRKTYIKIIIQVSILLLPYSGMNLLDNIFRQVFDVKDNALSLVGLYQCHFSKTHNSGILRCPYSIGPKVQNFVIFHPILLRAILYPIVWI